MTKDELSRAVTLSKLRTDVPFADTSLEIFNGFALKGFKPVHVSIKDVADLIRWQCSEFGGGFDSVALNEIATHGRKKFIIIG